MITRIAVKRPANASPVIDRVVAVLKRQIESRCSATVEVGMVHPDYTIELGIDSGLSSESYAVTPMDDRGVRITGHDDRGILYGVGRWLRASRYDAAGFTPGTWRGASAPAKPWRAVYLATHFSNFYQQAPIQKVVDYVEDLALWGTNTIIVWYDMHHYLHAREPAAVAMQERLKRILHAAKAIGLDVGLTCLGNEAYAGSPSELRADYQTGRAVYHVELCPNRPGAMEQMLRWFDEELEIFAEVHPDYLALGPYDQGGCACAACKPWGANGYLKIARAKAERARARFPGIRTILSTWLFDHGRDQGEWQGLAEAFATPPDWCHYIMADSHTTYPTYPLTQGVPGGLPLLNFPEISMWNMHPWGGFGANPLPHRFGELWQKVKAHLDGGMPYSEGIYEDINKVLCLQWYWAPDRCAEEIVKEYAAFEYSPDVADEVWRAIGILEANHGHIWAINWTLRYHYRFIQGALGEVGNTREAVARLTAADARLSPQARASWRWRILLLRALIDHELSSTSGLLATEACERHFEELTAIYHAELAEYKCAPPTRQSVLAMRATERTV